MEHVVFFTGADGAALFRRTPSLQEAARFVEHLRNVEGVDDSRVFSLSEVPLAFKTVYRVELLGEEGVPTPAPLPPMPAMPDLEVAETTVEGVESAEEPVAEPAEAPEPVMAAVPGEPYAVSAPPAEEAPSNGKGRGMGFFSR